MSSLAERYAAGDRAGVWNELHARGSLADAGDGFRNEARAVAVQTMKRAAANITTIQRRLLDFGYVFNEPRRARHEELLDPIEFVYSRSEIAYQLEMREEYPDGEPPPASQPYFEAAAAFFAKEPFELVFAGDFFHKNEVSGGGPTVALLPADTTDVRVLEDNGAAYTDFVDSEPGDEDGIWFIDYLRRYFARGGFRRMRPDHVYPPAFRPGLAEGLLEI